MFKTCNIAQALSLSSNLWHLVEDVFTPNNTQWDIATLVLLQANTEKLSLGNMTD